MTPIQLHEALHDPASWVKTVDATHRMVMIMRTDAWDRLVAHGSPTSRPRSA
jgi:hypothetical protein